MNKRDCYVIDGCVDFIPVKRSALTQNGVEVTIVGSSTKEKVLVDKVYQMSKIFEPQKPVIPQFVAEWIEECKRSGWHLRKALYRLDDYMEVGNWAYDENDDLIPEKVDMIARAWLDGYEIEQEKLYTVEIPDPNKNVLMMNVFKQIVIKKEFGDGWKKEKGFQLTESEIKKDFEWAWDAGFAKEVE